MKPFSLYLSAAGFAFGLSSVTQAQQPPEPNDFQKEIIARRDGLTILQFNSASAPAADAANHVRIYCPHHEQAKELAGRGGAAVLAFGTAAELRDAIEDSLMMNQALEIPDDSSMSGYVMAFIDTDGKLHPAYSLRQAAKRASGFKTDADLKGAAKADPALLSNIQTLYTNFCFGNS